ncbi:Acetyltransferase (isoleucine patch superfamily) [Chryseobacterium ureilyticum]|uniref:Acetyltransferase (Isoleucine patch superfamily) n=1 Tax=Chryseobacterium ureilyticum TaxID=373668 RepID=A0A1N7LAN8_9FLAO|nr:acyltransferase [Chryseobacterium ureilyticum]SIS70926.1 Acetyltransferase (isoleucine patch superfamily) [Chryseobacterium ureilyticum]
MKTIVEKIIRLRNPGFCMDNCLDSRAILQLAWVQLWSFLRGLKVLLFLKPPKGMLLGKRVGFFNISKMKWGKFLRLGNDVYVSALAKEGIEFGDNVSIGAFSRIIVSTSFNNIGKRIKIGNNVGIGEFAYLGGSGGLEIGDECIVGQYLSCHPENHNYEDLETSIRHQGVNRKGIKIGKNCWIGSKVTILDGVEIGDGCILAAGSVITKSFPRNSIIGGVPAKLLKTRTHEYQTDHTGNLLCRESV